MPQTRTWEGPGKHLFLFPEEAVAGWALHWPWRGVKSGEILVIAGWGESQETSRATGWGEQCPVYIPPLGGGFRTSRGAQGGTRKEGRAQGAPTEDIPP